MKAVKSNVRMASEKAKHGGKKGAKAAAQGKKGAAKTEEAEKPTGPENVLVFVAFEYPDWQKETLNIMSSFEFDSNNKIQGEFIKTIKEKITGPKQGLALKFSAHIAKEAEIVGKDAALETKTPFNEIEIIESNKAFIFENMPGLNNIRVVSNEQDCEVENTK